MTAIRIGSLTFNASPSDYGAIRVDIITPGDRDFITLEPAEWQSLELAAASLSIAERRAESDRLEIARLQLQRDEARERSYTVYRKLIASSVAECWTLASEIDPDGWMQERLHAELGLGIGKEASHG